MSFGGVNKETVPDSIIHDANYTLYFLQTSGNMIIKFVAERSQCKL